MKTFHKYLLSYLCILLIPIMIFVIVISRIVTHDCMEHLIYQMEVSLDQFMLSVDMQTEQLDAYVVQTTERSAFYARNQEDFASLFEIRRNMAQWVTASGFFNDIYFYNSNIDKAFSYDAVYTLEDLAYWRFNQVLTEADLRTAMRDAKGGVWLAAYGESGEILRLLYMVSARVSQSERSWLIGSVDLNVLTEMAEAAMPYTEGSFALYSASGSPLFLIGPNPPDLSRAPLQHQQILLDGVKMECIRSSGDNGLICISTVASEVLNASLGEIWSWMYIGLVIIFALGFAIITLLMHINYAPIQRLESVVTKANLPGDHSIDPVESARKAIQTLQTDKMSIQRSMRAVAKECAILKLLTGSYTAVEEFNRENAELGLSLQGDRWHIIYIRSRDDGATIEENTGDIVETVQQCADHPSGTMYLEVPENRSILFVVPGERGDHEKEKLQQALEESAVDADVLVGRTCSSIDKLTGSWQHLSLKAMRGEGSERPIDIFREFLGSDIGYNEPERIRFVFQELEASLPELHSPGELQTFCYDVLNLSRQKLEETRYGDEVVRLEAEMTQLDERDESTVKATLCRLEAIFTGRAEELKDRPDEQIDRIRAYLDANYRDPNFTVRQTAEEFNISVSNLSHYFKSRTGLSVSEYVEQCRILEAQHRLCSGDDPVADIAFSVGYTTPATFMRAFKKVTGMTPTAWRNSGEKGTVD